MGDLNGRIGMDTSYSLVLTSIQQSDQGTYVCEATNDMGTAANKTLVQVMGNTIVSYIF